MWRRRPGDDGYGDSVGNDSVYGSTSRHRKQHVGDCIAGDSVGRHGNEQGGRIVDSNLIVRCSIGCHQRRGE